MKASYSFISKMVLSFIVLIVIVCLALGYGAANTSFQDLYEAIIGKNGGNHITIY